MRELTPALPTLGVGIGWRPELALYVDRRPAIGFVEVIAESIARSAPVPRPLAQLRERGVPVLPHGVSLSLGGAERPDMRRAEHLADLAVRLGAPLVSEHIAFVRGGGREAGHLLPVPRTRDALDVLVENVRAVQRVLPVPLALENVAAVFEWPGAELDEAEFLGEVVERTGALLVLDVANVYANAVNFGQDPAALLARFPLERVAYVHVGGGVVEDGVYLDTHAHAVPDEVFALLADLCALRVPPGVMLERDDHFPTDAELDAELARLGRAVRAAAPDWAAGTHAG